MIRRRTLITVSTAAWSGFVFSASAEGPIPLELSVDLNKLADLVDKAVRDIPSYGDEAAKKRLKLSLPMVSRDLINIAETKIQIARLWVIFKQQGGSLDVNYKSGDKANQLLSAFTQKLYDLGTDFRQQVGQLDKHIGELDPNWTIEHPEILIEFQDVSGQRGISASRVLAFAKASKGKPNELLVQDGINQFFDRQQPEAQEMRALAIRLRDTSK
jgi:hypothetical protein